MKPLKEQLCLRCEAKGVKKKAETFAKVDTLLDMGEEHHPLCNKCKDEWEKEYEEINTLLHFIV